MNIPGQHEDLFVNVLNAHHGGWWCRWKGRRRTAKVKVTFLRRHSKWGWLGQDEGGLLRFDIEFILDIGLPKAEVHLSFKDDGNQTQVSIHEYPQPKRLCGDPIVSKKQKEAVVQPEIGAHLLRIGFGAYKSGEEYTKDNYWVFHSEKSASADAVFHWTGNAYEQIGDMHRMHTGVIILNSAPSLNLTCTITASLGSHHIEQPEMKVIERGEMVDLDPYVKDFEEDIQQLNSGTGTAPATSNIYITFKVHDQVGDDEIIKLTGSRSQLGDWCPRKAYVLTKRIVNNSQLWTATIKLPVEEPQTGFEYKFIKVRAGVPTWEKCDNRKYDHRAGNRSSLVEIHPVWQ